MDALFCFFHGTRSFLMVPVTIPATVGFCPRLGLVRSLPSQLQRRAGIVFISRLPASRRAFGFVAEGEAALDDGPGYQSPGAALWRREDGQPLATYEPSL